MNKLIYIAGFPRSGSTILQNVLNEVSDVVSVGEIKTIISYNIFKEKPCGCGEKLSDCQFWKPVINELINEYSIIELKEFEKSRKLLSNKNFHKFRKTLRIDPQLNAYAEFISKLYSSIYRNYPNTIIVDSSKDPSYGLFLDLVLDCQIFYVHLIRNPKDAYLSHSRDNVKSNLIRWTLMNWNCDFFRTFANDRYLAIKYESFVQEPEKVIASILEYSGIREENPIVRSNKVMLGVNHTLAGNPNRFRTGEIEIKKPQPSGFKLRKLTSFTIDVLNMKLINRYGYR